MNSDLTEQVVSNTRNIKSMQNQRRSTIVRTYGEEHTANFVNGTATFYLPVDTDMQYMSELKFKLLAGDVGSGGTIDNPTGGYVEPGTATYATMDAWLAAFPEGTFVDTDGYWGAQCWDYANAFWLSQVNRTLQTGSHRSASDTWRQSRVVNAGTEFGTFSNKNLIKKGDWIVLSGSADAVGHIALAAEDYNGTNYLQCYGQNQGGTPVPQGGAAINKTNLYIGDFVGAFRYAGWTTSPIPHPI